MAEELIYQSSHEGQEIDDAVDNLGTPKDTSDKNTAFGRIAKLRENVGEATDEAAAAGSLYARQKQNAADIEAVKNAGTLRDLFVAAGAVFNNETGFYEYGDYKDITEEEMMEMYVKTWNWWLSDKGILSYATCRTNLRPPFFQYIYKVYNLLQVFNNSQMEYIDLTTTVDISENYKYIKASNLDYSCQESNKLREIRGIIDVSQLKTSSSPILNGPALEKVRLSKLKTSINLRGTPMLSVESVLYLVQNSAATSNITVTLHPNAYARAVADPEVQAALQEKTNVSLAQEETE